MSRGGSARQRRNERRQSERLVAAGLNEAHAEESTGVEDAQPTDEFVAAVTAPMADEFVVVTADGDVGDIVAVTDDTATAAEEEFDVDAALESLAAFADDMGSCANCSHAYDMHDGGGECSMDECSCKQFAKEPTDSDGDGEGDGHSVKAATPAMTLTTITGGEAVIATGSSTNLITFALQNMQFIDQAGNLLVYTPADGTGQAADTFQPALLEEAAVPVLEPTATPGLRWVATLCPEGKATADGRIFAPGSISWRDLPLSLMGMIETAEGHDGAQVCGRIDRIWRDETTGEIMGAGVFDSGEYGGMIARLVGDGTLRGVSVDIAVAAMEIAPKAEVVDADGNWVASDDGQPDEPKDEVDPIDVLFGGEDMMFVVLEGVIGAATVCPFPAFAEAKIEVAQSLVAAAQAPNVWTVTAQAGFRVTGDLEASLTASAALSEVEGVETEQEEEIAAVEGLTASAAALAPLHPPASWFENPELDELTPLTVTDDGHVFGHVAPWGVCHIGIPGVCTTAPQTAAGYAYYMTKEVVCEDGFRVTVGTVTMDTDHAGRDVGRAAAASHYDNTGVAVADVVVGEDEFGIWMSGAIRPDLAAEKVRALQGASVSGDWREVNGNLELVGVLAVNVPGFPIPRLRASLVASGDGMAVTSLIAAGIIGPDTAKQALNRADLAELANLAALASSEWDDLDRIAREA